MTKLPNESDGNTVQSGRWNTILGKLQESTDTDVTIRGRKATFGTVVSLSAASFVGLSGAAGYYGVRAEDYITSGDGSAANPYNASAIQSAVNALPTLGGIVFIKGGIWRGATAGYRISVPASQKKKHVIFRGEGTRVAQIYGDDASNNMLVGTHIQAGFDIYHPCDFYDMAISPHPTNFKVSGAHGIHMINDITALGGGSGGEPDNIWTQGYTIQRVKFKQCDNGIQVTGQNMGSVFFQMWNFLIEQCGFIECNRGIRMNVADVDSTAPSQGLRGRIIGCEFRSVTGGRALDIDMSSSKLELGDILLEGCGAATGDYALRVDTFGDGGTWIHNIDFGDGSVSPKDAYFELGREAVVDMIEFRKDIDIASRGIYRVGRTSGASGVVNILSGASELTLMPLPGKTVPLGTISASDANKQTINIVTTWTPRGFIGNTTPGASPFTYTNIDMVSEYVYLVGGTVTAVSRDGQTLGAILEHHLSPGDSIVITYSSAPSIKRFGVS